MADNADELQPTETASTTDIVVVSDPVEPDTISVRLSDLEQRIAALEERSADIEEEIEQEIEHDDRGDGTEEPTDTRGNDERDNPETEGAPETRHWFFGKRNWF